MPGIVGLLTKSIKHSESNLIFTMLKSMLHEPFYTHGVYVNEEYGYFVGFSAIENSFADCMPVFNETKDIVLFLTGECYDYPEVREGLRSHGHNFNQNDASYLVHRYEESEEKLFRELNGWFNGIILDLRQKKALLFNDRYGIRRLYILERPGFLAFASEAKALLKAFPELKRISNQAIGEFLLYDCVLQNRTYFPEITLLPPGSVWIYKDAQINKKVGMDMTEFENLSSLQLDQFTEKLEDTFERVLPNYFQGGPIGLGLTGGLDTRTIIACRNPQPGKLPCYTFTGSYKDILDAKIAPKVAKICQQNFTKIVLEDTKLIKEYPSLVERVTYISDGLEGTDKADVLYFNAEARRIAPVRMTGKYGSQVLKGIFGFKPRPPSLNIINKDFKSYLDLAQSAAKGLEKIHPLTFLLQGAIPWWWNAFVTLETSQIEIRSPFLDNELIQVLYQAPPLPLGFGIQFELNLIAKNKPELMKIPTTGTYGGTGIWPIPGIRKSFTLTQLILDKIYTREELPKHLTHLMAKLDNSFITPLHLDRIISGRAEFRRYRLWFRDELSDYIRDILLSEKTLSRPYWNRQGLTRVVNDHIKGQGNYLREIRKVLQVELLHRALIERSF